MYNKNNKVFILLFVLIFSFLNLTKEYNVNIIYILYISMFIQQLKSQYSIRRLWEEKVKFRDKRDKEPEDYIAHCDSSDYKYKIFYAVGQDYTYTKNSLINNEYNAVSKYLL